MANNSPWPYEIPNFKPLCKFKHHRHEHRCSKKLIKESTFKSHNIYIQLVLTIIPFQLLALSHKKHKSHSYSYATQAFFFFVKHHTTIAQFSDERSRMEKTHLKCVCSLVMEKGVRAETGEQTSSVIKKNRRETKFHEIHIATDVLI